ncbi:MAG: helicase SNF2, partial [Halobacteria archaeon]|nr:helicase SNF2 [Halobacteria archaeon]
DEPTTLEEFVQSSEQAEDIEQTLEEFGFDSDAVRAEDEDGTDEFDVTVGEVSEYVREDLVLLARFLTIFIGDVSEDSDTLSDEVVEVRSWLDSIGVGSLPDPPEDADELVYPHKELEDVLDETREFYEAVFAVREFRDPKIDRLVEVLNQRDDKVLIFTQYRATARYLHSTLVGEEESPLTHENSAMVVGGDENKRDVIKRFAPKASGYQETLEESSETELEYVVATDTL